MRGEYTNKLDDKGRLMIPPKIRKELGFTKLILTRSREKCLRLYSEEGYEKIEQEIMGSVGCDLDERILNVNRRLIAACSEIEMDKAGRINIPTNFREYASLKLKENCTILGSGNFIEIWSEKSYTDWVNNVDENIGSDVSYLLSIIRKEGDK